MVVGKPDFDLNSFGIQYKNKKVNYTNKRSGINISSTTQSEPEDSAEKKVMNKLKPTGVAPVETKPLTQMVDGKQVDKPEDKKFGKQSILGEDALPATSTPPTKPHEEGVFDNVPQSKEDMITQEGGSKAGKIHMKPAPPKAKLEGRASQNATIKLHENKQNPILPKNAANNIILDMNILKLDLMKVYEGEEADGKLGFTGTVVENGVESNWDNGIKVKKLKNPTKLGKSAEETIFKAISLKLDLIKTLASNAGSTPVKEGTYKDKPNHIGNQGIRTQDGQHTVRGHGVGTPQQVTVDGVKTTQPREVAVKPKGNKKTSLRNNVTNDKKLDEASTSEIKESFDMITNNEAYQEAIHRDAPLTVEEGTEKFDAADPKTQAIRARIAARAARKKKSIDEINTMTNDMKELLKIKDPLANRKRKIRAQGYESAADYDKYQDAGNTYSDLDEDSHARQEQ